ncbi:MAG: DUF4388 domain-containing protein [Thermoanaerobaculia bacterium]
MPSPRTDGPDEARILRGLVEDLPLSDILQFLQVGAKSGALFLNRPTGDTAVITFRNGNIVQAVRTDAYQTLGDRLIDKNLITVEQLHDSLAYLAHFPGMRIGDALVDRGVITREIVEREVRHQITETIESLMTWTNAEFEFRIGMVSLGRGLPNFAVDLVLADGVEPRHLLLEASLLKDNHERGSAETPPEDEEARTIHWFDDGSPPPNFDAEDPEQLRVAHAYLSVSEELFSASERGEMALLLLRYASELYGEGGLLLRDAKGFRLLGQFGSAFSWGEGAGREQKMSFPIEENPLLKMIATDGRPYAGYVSLTREGGLAMAQPRTPGAVPILAVPLLVLGRVSLVLFCRSPLASLTDARALIALARQISIGLENLALREVARRKPPA